MLTESFRIEGAPRSDGQVYFTSPDLPGFRLLLQDREGDASVYSDEIISALKVFYPLYKQAEARRKVTQVTTSRLAQNGTSSDRKTYGLLASVGLAPA